MKNERGWNPNDQGSVAYNGINRMFHSTWKGWAVIDQRTPAKRGTPWPDLEPLAKDFYRQYWKDAGYFPDNIADYKIAALLADMSTQHGRWKQIVIAGLYGKDPMDSKLNLQLTSAEYNMMNKKPAESYKKIADARLIYCQKVKLVKETDRPGIIARATKYVNDAVAYLKANPGAVAATGGTAILAAIIFFF